MNKKDFLKLLRSKKNFLAWTIITSHEAEYILQMKSKWIKIVKEMDDSTKFDIVDHGGDNPFFIN